MIGLHSYLVEVDLNFYKNSVVNGVDLYEPYRGGMEGDIYPKHGKIIASIDGSAAKAGDVLFFIHFELYHKERNGGKDYVLVPTEHALGYSAWFPEKLDWDMIAQVQIKSLTFLVAEKIINPKWENADGAIIQEVDVPKYRSRVYRSLGRKRSLGIKKGDTVWTYGGSEYFIQYIPHLVFLDTNFITYNETNSATISDFCLLHIETIGAVERDIVSPISKKLQGIGRVLLPQKGLRKGDIVRFDIGKAQISPVNHMLYTPRYNCIMSRL